jgi:hypothetical protein
MEADQPAAAAVPDGDVRPPLGTWRRLYALVLGVLALEIVLLALVARAFG